jgi:hypothetical protein
MKSRWIVIHPDGINITQVIAVSYFKVYDWAITKFNGKTFTIIPFEDNDVETITID